MQDLNMVQKKLKKTYKLYLKYFYKKSIIFKIQEDVNLIRVNKKQLKTDTVYETFCTFKFINILIKNGKKTIAEKIFYNFLKSLKLLLKKNFKLNSFKFTYNNLIFIFVALLKNIKIPFNVKNIRIGGRVYLVPFLVKLKQQQTVAIKFLLNNFISKNKNKNKFLFKDIKDIFNIFLLQSSLNKNLNDYYKLAYDNRAFSHYRWF